MSFSPGDAVIVKDERPEALGPAHIRTPHYLRGRTGQVIKHLGAFPNPEDLAFARPAAIENLYHVKFALRELWPEATSDDEVLVEIYEPWLIRP